MGNVQGTNELLINRAQVFVIAIFQHPMIAFGLIHRIRRDVIVNGASRYLFVSSVKMRVRQSVRILRRHRVVARAPARAQRHDSLRFLVHVIVFMIRIFVRRVGIAQLLAMFNDFFAFFFLPSSRCLMVPSFVGVISSRALILSVIHFALTSGIAIHVFRVFRSSMRIDCLILIVDRTREDAPYGLVRSSINEIR